MYKAKSEAMMRGAQKRDREPLTPEDIKKFKSTKISRTELRHFNFGVVTREALLSQLAPIVKGYVTAGFRTPKDVARLLNKNGVKTACGAGLEPAARLVPAALPLRASAEGGPNAVSTG